MWPQMGSLQADVAGEEDCERHGGVEVAAGEVAGREGHDCDGEPELQTDRHRRGLVNTWGRRASTLF